MKDYEFHKPNIFDRLICATTYLTMGLVGIVWLLLLVLFKKPIKPFVNFHATQSIVFSLIVYILSLLASTLVNLLSPIPLIGRGIFNVYLLLTVPIHHTFSVVGLIVGGLIFYMALFAFLGKYSYVPYISDIIRRR